LRATARDENEGGFCTEGRHGAIGSGTICRGATLLRPRTRYIAMQPQRARTNSAGATCRAPTFQGAAQRGFNDLDAIFEGGGGGHGMDRTPLGGKILALRRAASGRLKWMRPAALQRRKLGSHPGIPRPSHSRRQNAHAPTPWAQHVAPLHTAARRRGIGRLSVRLRLREQGSECSLARPLDVEFNSHLYRWLVQSEESPEPLCVNHGRQSARI